MSAWEHPSQGNLVTGSSIRDRHVPQAVLSAATYLLQTTCKLLCFVPLLPDARSNASLVAKYSR